MSERAKRRELWRGDMQSWRIAGCGEVCLRSSGVNSQARTNVCVVWRYGGAEAEELRPFHIEVYARAGPWGVATVLYVRACMSVWSSGELVCRSVVSGHVQEVSVWRMVVAAAAVVVVWVVVGREGGLRWSECFLRSLIKRDPPWPV